MTVDGWNVLDVVSAVFGVVPLVLAFLYHQLPSTKFRGLDDVLQETESLLFSSLEDGLIPDSKSALPFTQHVEQLRGRTECMRLQVYCAKTYWQELKYMVSGLTTEISMLSDDVLDLRAKISATSSSSRARLREDAEFVPPQGAAGTVADADDGATPASVPLGGPSTAATRFWNISRGRLSGFLASEAALVDFPAGNVGSCLSGRAEAAHACCCGGHVGYAYRSYAGSSTPRVLPHSYSVPSLPFEGGDAACDRVQRTTMHLGPGPSSSPDTTSACKSDVPSCGVGAIRDVVVDVPRHRCSR